MSLADTSGGEDTLVRRIGADLLQLAFDAIDYGLEHKRPPQIHTDGLCPDLTAQGASFVTLKSHGELRGCIGSAMAWRSLALDVSGNAFGAAFKDSRFAPLEPEIRQSMSLSVSVLTAPSPMSFTSQSDLLDQLRVGVDGLIIRDGGASALFLPAVWDAIADKKEFLDHLKSKAGLPVSHWSSSFTAFKFTSQAVSRSAQGVLSYTDE